MKQLNAASLTELRQLYRDIRGYQEACTDQRTTRSATRYLSLTVNKYETCSEGVEGLFFREFRRIREMDRELQLKSRNQSIATAISNIKYSAEKLMTFVIEIGNDKKQKQHG